MRIAIEGPELSSVDFNEIVDISGVAKCGPSHKFGGPFTDQFRVYTRTRCVHTLEQCKLLYKAAHLHAQAAKEM